MKILFSDINGVLNSERSSMVFGGYPDDFDIMLPEQNPFFV